MLDSVEEVLEKGLKGRAALFISGTGQLFVNGLYEAVDRTAEDIEPEFVEQADEEAIRTSVVEAARTAMAYRVGKAVVYALAKRANEDWSEGDLATALAKESLSLAADDYLESLSRVRRQVRDAVLLVLGKNNLLDQLPAVVDIFPSANVPPDLFSKHDLIAPG